MTHYWSIMIAGIYQISFHCSYKQTSKIKFHQTFCFRLSLILLSLDRMLQIFLEVSLLIQKRY